MSFGDNHGVVGLDVNLADHRPGLIAVTVQRRQSELVWPLDHGGGLIGSRTNGSDSPTGIPMVGVLRPMSSASGTPRTGSAPGPVPRRNFKGNQTNAATSSGLGPLANGLCWPRQA